MWPWKTTPVEPSPEQGTAARERAQRSEQEAAQTTPKEEDTINFVESRGHPPVEPEKKIDTGKTDGGPGHPVRDGQVMWHQSVRPKTAMERNKEALKVDELAEELKRQYADRQAKADAVARLDHDAKVLREQATAEREVIEQARKQAEADAEWKEQNDRYNIQSWQRVNKDRAQDGLPPVDLDTFMGEQA